MTQVTIDRAMQFAVQRHQVGKLGEAEEIYRRVLGEQPDNSEALHLLGVLAHQTGRVGMGIELIRRAITISPERAHYHNNLGNALRDNGLGDDAILAYRQAVRLKPDYAEGFYNLGVALGAAGEIEEAIGAYRRAVQIKPDYAAALNNLGNALRKKGSADEAIVALREAVRVSPSLAQAHNNLGNALLARRILDEADGELREAIRINPGLVEAYYSLSVVLREKGLLDEASACCRKAMRLNSDEADVHDVLASILLLKGELGEGFLEYEWRWRTKDYPEPRGKFSQPRWGGEDLDGRTIFLHAEGGFGDTIQFARYVPMVAERGGKVVLECLGPLLGLIKNLDGVERVVSTTEALPDFDVHCPQMSLPWALGTTIETIPAEIPYLRANGELVESWRKRLGPGDGKLKIGIAWGGSRGFKEDRVRSLRLEQLGRFGAVSGVKFYSLQKGVPGEEAKSPPAGFEFVDLGPELRDFSDTAAVMASMDLIVSTDTSVAHLAGALGRPVWVMLQFVPDWRWMMEREDSPWYPTMRLFRQKRIGDWGEVIGRVAEELGRFDKEKSDA